MIVLLIPALYVLLARFTRPPGGVRARLEEQEARERTGDAEETRLAD